MALEKPAYTDMNINVADISSAANMSKWIIWSIPKLLKGELTGTNGPAGAPPLSSKWTHVASCDSVSVSTVVGTDLWPTTFDATKIVRASSGVHSWITVTNGTYWVTFDYLTAADANIIMVVSKTAPTGGTTSARPTATDEWVHTSTALHDGTAAAHKVSMTRDANGYFWFVTQKTGSGRFPAGLCFQVLTDVRISGDSYPVFSTVDYNAGTGAGATGPFHSSAGLFLSTASKGRTPSGAQTGTVAPLGYKYNVAGSDFLNQATYISNTDGGWDGLPMLVASEIASNIGVRGRVPDAYFGSAYVPQGSVHPATGNIERMFVGSSWLPFTVAPVL